MPRSTRLLIDDQPTVYHVISRTCLDGFPLSDKEKDHFLAVVHRFAAIYFAEILGFCVMGNHFHMLVRMPAASSISDEAIAERYLSVFKAKTAPNPIRLNELRTKWTSLSEFIGDIKQHFSLGYNKRHQRKGTFWAERFKSVIVQDGRTLVNCLAYIDLNPIRAGIEKRPEDYRWCSLGYHLQSRNSNNLLSLDFGMQEWDVHDPGEQLRLYREFVYLTGAVDRGKGVIDKRALERAQATNFQYTRADRFMLRVSWYTRGTILGTQDFVEKTCDKLGLKTSDNRRPIKIPGLDETYSHRRPSE